MQERTGEAFEFDEKLTVVGPELQIGDTAPEFALDDFDGAAMRTVKLTDTAGKVRLLNVVNSVDTPVCHTETRRWDAERSAQASNIVVYTISMDLPFALERWGKSESVRHRLLSAHRETRFGEDYGVLLKEWRLLQRAVFVIDGGDQIAYAEYVADQMREPNYAAVWDAARAAS